MRFVVLFLFISIFNDVNSQIDTIIWTQKASLPDSLQRTGPGFFLIDSDFYVAGGQLGGSGTINVVWKYHVPTDSWVQMRNLPFGGAACGGSFVLNGNGYFLTARDSINNFNCDTMFWEYNASDDTWTRRAGFPDDGRQNSSFFSYGGMGYVACTSGCVGNDNHLWQYNPVLDTWTQMASLPDAIASGRDAVASPPSAAYLFCGQNDFSGSFINDVMRYNIDANSWDSIGQMPGVARWFPVFWGFDSVLIGGGGSDGLALLNDFYRYDILLNTWIPVVFQNSFDSAEGGATFIFGKTAYYFGGASTAYPNITFNNNMWSFDASKYIHDTTTGIMSVKNQGSFNVYPNPVDHDQNFSISTSENGEIIFYDALGLTLDDRKLLRGLNQIKLTTDNEVVFYKATLQDGATENGKMVFIR